MSDVASLRASLQQIDAILARQPHGPELRAAHLDLVTLAGQLQGAVSERRRGDGETPAVRDAEASLDAMKAGVRQVGMDIRLASEGTLQFGLEACVRDAFQVLDDLKR